MFKIVRTTAMAMAKNTMTRAKFNVNACAGVFASVASIITESKNVDNFYPLSKTKLFKNEESQ